MPVNILCPNCKQELSINPQNGLEEKKFDCPKCKQTLCIGDSLPKFSLCANGKAHQLHFGRQWVGREVPNSVSDILISDKSNEMSRHHALIDVHCIDNGIAITLEDHGKNSTEVQGVELINGDIVYLDINDAIRMGQVKMYISNEYGDQTI